ncbi:unnamed protein product [Schistosoma curassoni]|uniref:Uncharacterized protein n=1 Tax=Schistosoma curassoni TaxID=6186 RepID=A0A183KF21_9TREM|nr:unnamed protein product [Schistosoma curassoni]
MQLDDLDFTVDLALLSHTHQQMQMKATGIAAASASVGLIIQNGKCKISKCNTENTNPITLDEEALESFAYLNSIIDKQGRSDADVKARIGKARTALLQSKNIWNSKQLSTNIKMMDSTSFANSSGLPTRFGFNESFFNNSAFGTALSNGVSNNPKET